ncbi:MAG: sigma-54-dependent Fis family transcriptional regulator [Bacteroidetes bacterium]|jgi:two-component system nitrogen regulation response regulator NtrX|nr:sigma-54-dependent Fis family transcriptional regulator [Bacteroidota bacterium]MBL0016854.1 sigma-54-dependent Fis family transcriptional regulator [Bacteroidota bacterium]MBP6639623.1 sigma-54-dependent Fis family transcriptional regulator [Bacteroidia bacterium]MBP6721090.1 sigma-54-dependent Fis family transcriptional regulator [Bacteroidia bacterium]MBP8073295.1 sigma-54-dependent Fis family transcriptional regulator [Bacteroidia bacterium]
MKSPRILIIDDEESIRSTLKDILEYEDYKVETASDGEEGLAMIKDDEWDVILCDVKMPKRDGIEVLELGLKHNPELQFIMISGHANIDTAVECTKKGAYDFIQKPPDLNRLLVSVRNAMDKSELVTETRILKRKVTKVREITGDSPIISKIKETIERVAPTDARVLVTGSNGTGKELVARWIHEKSNRAGGPIVEVNCAAIPSELIESELFGHEKGSFTGALKQRLGKFEQANGGTLFLDEIGDMSLSAQAKVLRALQEHKITRVGGDKDITVDVRIIAATNKDLLSEIEEGNFREDLYHRLSVILIHVPSLKDRKEDIPQLVDQFLREICEEYKVPNSPKVNKKAMEELMKLEWRGNVRELHNVIERLVIMSDGEITEQEVITFAVPRKNKRNEESIFDRYERFQDFKDYAEREFIEKKLRRNQWNITKTAEEIDIQRSHLYNKIEKYGLKRNDKN